jgi:hypothetical protein
MMRNLTTEEYQEIRAWVYRNARPLELALWQYHFEKGSKDAVISCLFFYQNDDGGFGQALEADSWNPNSSPYTTLRAASILEDMEFKDKQHPIMQGIFKFLESSTYCAEDGWYFSIPSNNEYPHAPWWTYDMEANEVEDIGLTAELAAFILRNADEGSELYNRALTFSDGLINKLLTRDNFGEMGIGGYCILLDGIKDAGLEERFDTVSLTERLSKIIYTSIERDTSKWINYTVRPSKYIKSPESIFYKDNEDIMAKELDYIIETRWKKGVWDIT